MYPARSTCVSISKAIIPILNYSKLKIVADHTEMQT